MAKLISGRRERKRRYFTTVPYWAVGKQTTCSACESVWIIEHGSAYFYCGKNHGIIDCPSCHSPEFVYKNWIAKIIG